MKTSITEALPSPLAEHPADAAVQAILAEICRCCGTRMPALIFRHLATYPGVVPAFWEHLGALYQDGVLQEAVWPLLEQLNTSTLLAPLKPEALDTLGMNREELLRARATLEQYNRSNPVNLLALLTLLDQIDSPPSSSGQAPTLVRRAWHPPPAPIEIPLPMAEVGAIDDPTRQLLNDLRTGDRRTPDPVVPSLYRHFAAYPKVLRLLHHHLAPRFEDGLINAMLQAWLPQVQAQARMLSAQLGPWPRALEQAAVLAAIRDFAHRVIPPMIVVGRSLHSALTPTVRSSDPR